MTELCCNIALTIMRENDKSMNKIFTRIHQLFHSIFCAAFGLNIWKVGCLVVNKVNIKCMLAALRMSYFHARSFCHHCHHHTTLTLQFSSSLAVGFMKSE